MQNALKTVTNNKLTAVTAFVNNILYNATVNHYELPNKDVITVAKSIYTLIAKNKSVKLTSDFPLQDGGIAFQFIKNNVKYLIEAYNDNEDVFSIVEAGQPIKAWDFDHEQLMEKLSIEVG